MTVLAYNRWPTNGHMIAAAARLGYITGHVLDPTYGGGGWWTVYRPAAFTGTDLYAPDVAHIDFRAMPWDDDTFDTVAYDPPYKLKGTSTDDSDVRWGIGPDHMPREERHALMRDGMTECARVLAPSDRRTRKGETIGAYRHLLVKCQDQVEGGRVRWQTRMMTDHGEMKLGLILVDRFEFLTAGGRPQPQRTRADGRPSVQEHARRNGSTLLVFRKPRRRG